MHGQNHEHGNPTQAVNRRQMDRWICDGLRLTHVYPLMRALLEKGDVSLALYETSHNEPIGYDQNTAC